jgi:DNA-binding SARP family transcriptional activator
MRLEAFPMTTLSVRLFGKFCAQCHPEAVPLQLHAGKVQELFCYLLLFRDHAHARERLATALWGENPTALAKKYLRQGLWQLQATLDSVLGPELNQLLAVDADYVQLSARDSLWLDVAQFEAAYALARGVRGRELSGATADMLKHAVTLYRGDLLEGWYQEWCLFERERLQNEYLLMLDKLMGYCEVQREYEQGLVYGDSILRHDRASEKTHQRLMRLYYAAGNRVRALRQYTQCVTALDEELGVKPGAATNALYDQMRADRWQPDAANEVAPPRSDAPLVSLLERLKHLQTNLESVQHQVQQEIKSIERSLNRTLH